MADALGTLTPEELAIAEQNIVPEATPPAGDALRDLDTKQLFDLAVSQKLNLAQIFDNRPDLHGDGAIVQKVADAQEQLRERGFTFSDLPGPIEAAKGVAHMGKGMLDYANAAGTWLTSPFVHLAGLATGQGAQFQKEVYKQGLQGAGEATSATEQAVFGLENLPVKAARKAGRMVGIKPQTPQERVQALWGDIGMIRQQQEISKGQGGLVGGVEKVAGALGAATVPGNTEQRDTTTQLEAQRPEGLGVRPEVVESAAAGDPASFLLFGKAFGGLAGGVNKLAPGLAPAIARGTTAAGEKLAEVVGKGVEKLGQGVEKTGVIVEKVGPPALTVIGGVTGAAHGGVQGAIYGAAGGQILKGAVKRGGQAIESSGAKLESLGQEMATGQIKTSLGQLATDVVQSAPGAALDLAEGAAFDIGLAATTAENPAETQAAAAFGTVLGLGKGALRNGRHIISGQIAGPRAWGTTGAMPAKKTSFPALGAMHNSALANASPGVQARVGAILKLLNKTDSEFFLAQDSAAMEKALVDTGVSPENAAFASQQLGLFTGEMPGPDGKPRRVVIARDIEAAPHEAKHAIQDVLGESANRQVDGLVQREYAPIWDAIGEEYANAMLGGKLAESGKGWREVVADASGWTRAEMAERIAQQLEAQSETVKQGGIMTGAEQASLRQQGQKIWDDLTSQGGTWQDYIPQAEHESFVNTIADRYLAREIAAENFDAAFKNLGESLKRSDLLGQLANAGAKAIKFFGGDPLAGRASAVRKLPLKQDVMTATVEGAKTATGQPAGVEPKAMGPATVRPSVGVPGTPATPVQEAEAVRAAVAEKPTGLPMRDESARTMAQAMENNQGVQVSYWGAKGEPGGDPAALRPERRAEIEAQRDAQNSDRQLVTKHFFPYKAVVTGKGVQFYGWSPNNFNANVARFSDWLTKVGAPKDLLPYDIATDAGRKALQNDVNAFVQNQSAGFTGSGRELVVPKEMEARGFFKPEQEGLPVGLPQERADIINYLFASKLPATTRVTGGKVPLNVAGQKVSAATAPELARVVEPVRPIGEYAGEKAEAAGVAGERVQEVNPFRQRVEQLAKDAGIAPPKLIEASQRLNLEHLADATVAPELPQFTANTLTLQAGFQPAAFEVTGQKAGERVKKTFTADDMMGARRLAEGEGMRVEGVTPAKAGELDVNLQMQPPEIPTREQVAKASKDEWANMFPTGGLTGGAYRMAAEAKDVAQLREWDGYRAEHSAKAQELMRNKDFDNAMTEITKAQYYREAIEAATDTLSGKGRLENPPLRGVQYQAETDAGRAVEEKGFTFRRLGSPINRELQILNEDGTQVGRIISVSRKKGEAEVSFVRVDESLRKQGVGEALYRELLTDLQKDGITKLTGEIVGPGPVKIREKLLGPGETTYTNWRGEKLPAEKAATLADEEGVAAVSKISPELQFSPERFKGLDEERAYELGMKESMAYFAKGHGEFSKGDKVWMWDTSDRSVDVDSGAKTHGSRWGHEVTNATFKGRYDAESKTVTVVFPESELRELGKNSATVDDIPTGVYDALKRQFKTDKFDVYPKSVGEIDAIPETEYQPPGVTMGDWIAKQDREAGKKAVVAAPTPQKKSEWTLKPAGADAMSKAWILPNGSPVQLGGKWHHAWLSENPKVAEKYGLKVPKFEGEDVAGVREQALKKGFVRIDYGNNDGSLVVEARAKDWRGQKDSVYDLIAANEKKIDHVEVYLFNDAVTKVVDQARESLFDKERPLDHIPFITSETEGQRFGGQYNPERFSSPKFEEEIDKIRTGKSGGVTVNPDGTPFEPKDSKVDLVSVASVNIPQKDLSRDVVLNALRSFSEVLDEPNVTAGLFAFDQNGKKMVSVDLNAVVPQEFRKNTVKFAKDNDQVAIWDWDKSEAVETGGAGQTKLNKLSEIYDALESVTAGKPVDVEAIQREYETRPAAAEQLGLGGEAVKEYDKAAEANMTRGELEAHYPEAVIPRRKGGKEQILHSEITESPLYKRAKNEEEAVQLFADKMVEYLTPLKETKGFQDGSKWYSEFVPRLKKAFGDWSERMAQLLAATSPQTNPQVNFGYALDAVRSWKDGRFDKIIKKFDEGMGMVKDGSWETWINKEIKSGNVPKAPETATTATFLGHWVAKHKLQPKQTNGSLYGMHSDRILLVFLNQWFDKAGPKTRNFVLNLLGRSDAATVDLWMDRTMRRIGYEGEQERWRILPRNQGGVLDADFYFAQKVAEAAGKKMGMKASALQGAAWFIEKLNYAKEGWGDLDLGDYRNELDKLPMMEQGYQLRAARLKKKEKPAAKQEELFDLVQPRKM